MCFVPSPQVCAIISDILNEVFSDIDQNDIKHQASEVAEFMVSRLLSQDSDIAFEDMSDWDDDDWL